MQGSGWFVVRFAACLALAAGTVACESRNHGESRPASAVSAGASQRDAGPNAGAPRIVVLGDSLTAGLGLPIEDAYPAVLQRRLDAKGLKYQVINAGISGDTAAGGLSRLDWA